jgi:AcrR family transcriptional regulator
MTEHKSTPKSRRTREAIEAAAKELFSEQGFDRTTVREIAARASIDPAMIIRYFGSKEDLFALVSAPNLNLPSPADIPAERLGETLVRHFLDQWEGPESGGGMPVLLRSAASNENAANRLRQIFATQVLPAVARIGDPATAGERAGLVASQLLGLALTRYVLKLPPVVGLSAETIVQQVGATVQRYSTWSQK